MPSGMQRPSIQSMARTVTSEDVAQGRILFLPPFHGMPGNSVQRVFGKGPVDEGMFDRPVVICSRPADEGGVVHFHIVTSFRGKQLDEIYGKANKFHRERRSHYLSVSPTPPHPDATTKAGKKNFPSLELQDGACLRWGSYVNVHGVYKISWSHLRFYGNVKTPLSLDYRLDKESLNRLLVRSKNLTGYVPGSQFEPGSAGISLRISNPAISSGNLQLARPAKPAIIVRALGVPQTTVAFACLRAIMSKATIRDTVRTAISLPLGLDLCLWSARLGIPLNMCGNGLEKPVGQSCVLVAASCIDNQRTDLAVEKLSAPPLPKTITKRAFEAPYPGQLEKPLTS